MLKKSLRTLHLHHNTLAQLPEGLFELLGLAELDVSHNQLTCLSPHIGRLVHLLDLRISHNRLTQLPQSIHLCSSLASIDMSHNALEWLPAEIKQLTKLRSLAADGNRFNILAIRIEKVASPMRLADIALQASGAALFEVLVKCGQPVPVRFLFCSLLCKTRHKRGLRERSVGGNIAGRTQQGNAAHGAAAHHPLVRARLRTWDGSSVNINLTH
nr:hypothetical protein HK105_005919 [Polyrhizophydium stewartii]